MGFAAAPPGHGLLRAVEPASSRGSRRRRWRSALGAPEIMSPLTPRTLSLPARAAIARARRSKGELAAQAVDAELEAKSRAADSSTPRPGSRCCRAMPARGGSAHAACHSAALKPLHEGQSVAVKRVAPLDHLDAFGNVGRRADLDGNAKTIEQLGGAVRPLQGCRYRPSTKRASWRTEQSFAFDHIRAGRRHIEQQIDDVVLEQIDLVDVEETPVRARQETRLE